MAVAKLFWLDFNYGSSGHRVYRDTSPLDLGALPAPLAELPPGTTSYTDLTVQPETTYYYIVSSLVGGGEYFSDEVILDTSVGRQVFDGLDLSLPVEDLTAIVDAVRGCEVVATIRNGAIAENTTLTAVLNDWGQHKWPQNTVAARRMWVLLRDTTRGNQLRVYAERQSEALPPNQLISQNAPWKFEALWQGNTYIGEGTWNLSDSKHPINDGFDKAKLSSDDGTWCFADGINTQGEQNKPSAPGGIWGAGNFNTSDSSAKMYVGDAEISTFRGLIVLAP